jgi:ABC-2 type transport system permease protein
LWLLRHELRLFWYSTAIAGNKDEGSRRADKLGLFVWATVWLMLHVLAFLLMKTTMHSPDAVPVSTLLALTVVLAAVFMFMLSSGLKASVEALFDRGDLDLLLSSPLPSRSIFTVRLVAIVAGVSAIYLFFVAPIAHAGVFLGRLRWLGLYPTIVGAAVIASAMAMLLTLGLVRLLGARRTRVVAQVIGAFAGALLFLLSQVYGFADRGSETRAAHRLAQWLGSGPAGIDAPVWLPARAALGEPLPLAGLSLLAAATFYLTVRFTDGFFLRGLEQAAGSQRAKTAPARGLRMRFGRPLADVIVLKEWRLIARDPHLVSQVLLQLLYLLPLGYLLFMRDGTPLPGIAAGLALLCGSLASSLAWIIILAEDAPDLLLASPASVRTVRYAKLAAATIPPLALVAPPLLWLVATSPLAGILCYVAVIGSVLSAALIVMWLGRPAPRGEFRTRGKRNLMSNLFEAASLFAWAGLAYLLLLLATVPSWPGAAGAIILAVFVAGLLGCAHVLGRRAR